MFDGSSILLLLLVGIVFVIVATARYKLHPFLALLIAAGAIGLASGMPAITALTAITGGFGRTVGAIGIVIACGGMIGAILERSGGALSMAESVLRLVGRKRALVAMAGTGAIVSVPVFCDSGFVLLAPLNRALSRQTGISIASFAVALGMGLYTTHCLVPPTPGPIAVAGELHADLGAVILLGLVAAIPAIAASCLYARFVATRIVVAPPAAAETEPTPVTERMPAAWAFAPVLVPVVLIALKSVAAYPGSAIAGALPVLLIAGDPNVALVLGVLIAMFAARRHGREAISEWCADGLRATGVIILITAAGGALGAVLRETSLAALVGDTLTTLDLGRLNILLPFVIAAGLKTAIGSSTVAMITTASLVGPLLGVMGLTTGSGPVLATLAIASGSMVVSHVNDSYFWVITQTSGLTITQGCKLITVASAIAGLTAIATVFALSLILL
ncbi:MAG TPA: SLC13 family permease [Opitutaceae bacterium]|nr:SLC13 family permease [Opitutaceae bacterium]